MKRMSIVIVLLVAAMLVGCSGVIMTAEYSQLLDQSAAWADCAADKAENGDMTINEAAAALRTTATHWAKFQDARDGNSCQK